MVYNKFGRISEEVSRFAMGCMRLSQARNEQGKDAIDEEESHSIRSMISSGR